MKYHTLPRFLEALRSSLEALNSPRKMGTAIKQEKALVAEWTYLGVGYRIYPWPFVLPP